MDVSSSVISIVFVSVIVWLPVVFSGMMRKGLAVILMWLLIAPIAINVIDRPGTNPLFSNRKSQQDVKGSAQPLYLSNKDARITIKEILQPTRLLFAGFLLIFIGETVLRRRRLGPFDNTEKLAFAFAVLTIISVLAESRRVAFGLRVACDAFIVPFIAYFCARRLVKTDEDFRRLTRVFGFAGCLVIGSALLERLTLPGLFNVLQGPFPGRHELYIFLLVVFFAGLLDFALHACARAKRMLPTLLQRALVFLAPLVILLGWGRGNTVGLMSGIGTFVFFSRHLVPLSPKMAAVGLALMITPPFAVCVYELTPKEVVESRIVRSSTVYSRLGAWENILRQIKAAPFFGIGFNNLRDALFRTRIRTEGVRSETHAHNSYLSVLAEMGFFGFAIFLALLGSLFRSGYLLYRNGANPVARWHGVALLAIMMAYCIPSLFANSLYMVAVSQVYVYTFIGAVNGLHRRELTPARALASVNDSQRRSAPAFA